MDDPRGDSDIAALDEILQILFWLRGENLGADANAQELARLTGLEPAQVGRLLDRLVAQGLVSAAGEHERRYALTERGMREGGRRFADEFAELMHVGHGQCSDPDCDCLRTGNVEDCRHRV